ncbi:hypothetical protein OSB04_006589 [Centaurea solstitialis]|uniref:CCHC-type domain-containing protein n=1 Tax=Centaurea solstitialis TaxID=347529 RepID=A0AA38TJZ8_9ASTR|nr:hypothetical protein OSB04_006589 [Centaurea solstitialis]
MSKDIKTITLIELYGMMLNHEQTKTLKSNLIRDSKDVKSNPLALISESPQPSQTPVLIVTITEIEDSDSEPVSNNETEFNESLALLSKHFKKFGRKGNFRKSKPLSIANKPETPSGNKVTSTCFKCQSKGHFATECKYKKNQFAESSTPASKDGKYQKLKGKYRKLKFQRIGKGLIAEEKGWDESSDESSDEEDTSEVTCLMAIIEETEPVLMAQLEDIPEEEVSATPSSTSALPLAQSSAEKVNFDLRTELKECHEKLKELVVFEANYKDQVHANQVLCIEREQAIAEREKALAELNSEKVTVKSWADASEKSSSSIPKDEASTSVQPPKNSKGKNLPNHPPKPKKPNHKTPKVLGGGPSGSGTNKSVQCPVPRIKIDLKTKPQEKTPIPPQTRDIGILGPGPAHLKFKTPKGPSKTKTYRNCYHCGQNDHIASKCPHATKAEKAAKVKKDPKANKSAKGKKPLVIESTIIPDPVNTETSDMTDDVASSSTTMKKSIWYLDSGCSKHMTGNKHVLSTTKKKLALQSNLVVKGELCDKDHKVSFSKKSCKVKNRHKKIILRGQRSCDVYIINMDTSTKNVCFMSRASSDINWLWHKRLSHLNFNTINKLSISKLVEGLPENSFAKESLCAACEKGKQTRATIKSKQISTINSPLHLLHIDLFGPVNIQSMGGKRYTLAKAVNTACYTQNRSLIVKRFKKTAYDIFRGRKPNIEYFHIFGCNCYIKNNRDALGKFDAKADDGFLVGYSTISKAYHVFNKRRQTIEETIHVQFDETNPFSTPSFSDNNDVDQWANSYFQVPENEAPEANIPAVGTSSPILDGFEGVPEIPQVTPIFSAVPINQVAPTTSQEDTPSTLSASEVAPLLDDLPQLDIIPEESFSTVAAEPLQVVAQPPALRWTRDHPIDQVLGDPSTGVKTRHQASNHCVYVCFLSENEPSKIEEALADPFWVSAMQEELAEFERNLVWILVHMPSRKTIIVFQMDVKSAFLNRKLTEEVYVAQPPGFADPKHPNHVYKLNKALYGLKQAPRAWCETLSTFLISEGFTRGKIDSTLFVKTYKDHVFLAQIYVDDIIFGSTKAKLCKKFESLMQAQYKISMMGELTYFLALQIKQSEKGIFISQGKYVREMLNKFELTTCSEMKTPMAPPLKLDKDSNGKPVDVTLYRRMIDSLLYLTASHPDIMYATCLCARYQADLKEPHMKVVKRIFRYLKGTPNLGLWYPRDSGFDLTAFSDSDFAGCKLDRKSTTGGCQLLGELVSWTSKKQNSVSTSTAEAEYVAVGSCYAQVLWMRNQLLDYGFQLAKIPIYCDNTSAVAITNNPVLHSKTKHIEIRYHFTRYHMMNGDVELHFVPTEYQLADLFTKPLDEKRFNQLISELGMLNPDA